MTHDNITMLNRKVVTVLTLNDLLKNIVIIQYNKIKHLINCLQIERFTYFIVYNIIIFLTQHSHTEKEERENICHKNLFSIYDRDNGAIGLSLLSYYKEMYIALDMVNKA